MVLRQASSSGGAVGGLLGSSWPVVALAGGGGLVAVAVLASSSGSDSDNSGSDNGGSNNGDDGDAMPSPTPSSSGNGNGNGNDDGAGAVPNAAPTVVTTGAMAALDELVAKEGASASWTVSDWFTDADADDTLTFTATLQKTSDATAMALAAGDWLVLEARTGALTIAAGATDNAEVGVYTLTLVASDGTASATHMASLTIVEDPTNNGNGGDAMLNAAPTVVATGATPAPTMLTAEEGAAASWDVSDWFTDANAGDVLTFAATLQKTSDATAMALAAVDWLGLEARTGALTIASGATDDAEVGVYTLAVTASDGMASTPHMVTLTIVNDPADGVTPEPDPGSNNGNSAPTLTDAAPTATKPLTVDEGAVESWTLADWFSDPDAGDVLTFTGAGFPTWLSFDSAMQELRIASGATDDTQVGSHSFTITASDSRNATVVLTATLAVEDVNETPVVVTEGTAMAPTATVTATEGDSAQNQSLTVSGWFSDPDTGDQLTFALGSAAADSRVSDSRVSIWATFDSATGVLALAFDETDDPDVGNHALEVVATDSEGLSATHTLNLVVENVPEAPRVVTASTPALLGALAEGMAASWDVSNWFTDPDLAAPGAVDALTYTGMVLQGSGDSQTEAPLPDWLELDGTTGALTIGMGATDDADVGTHTVAVEATDQTGGAASHTTTLKITDIAHEPSFVGTLSNRIAPAAGGSLSLDLAELFTDTMLADGSLAPANGLTFEVSDSIPDAAAENIVSAALTEGSMLVLTPGVGAGTDGVFQGRETIAITAVDGDDGRATVSFVVTTRAHVSSVRELASDHGFLIRGDMAEDELGASVSGAGDINGDGLADLIVGAYAGDDGGTNAGEAYILYGKAGTDGTQFGIPETTEARRQLIDTEELAPADGFVLQGHVAGDWLGRSVAGAGDINGDGLDDLIIGADGSDGGGSGAGAAYIVYGKAAAEGTQDGTQFGTKVEKRQVLDTTNLGPAAGFIVQGDAGNDALGVSVAGAGDVNGDGLNDLIIGAIGSNDGGSMAGAAYIVYGKTDTGGTQFGEEINGRQILDTTGLMQADGFKIQGDVINDQLGVSVSGAGDINGDGVGDLIIGADRGQDRGVWAGEAYIIYGKTGTSRQAVDTTNLAPADGFIIQGDETDNALAEGQTLPGDQLGFSVAGAGDVNGDGLDDLIVGAPRGDDGTPTPGHSDSGEAYIIYGKAGTNGLQFGTAEAGGAMRQTLDTSLLAPADGFILQGHDIGDQVGHSVAAAGDINGDGLADLIAGALFDNNRSETFAGGAYIIYGKAGTNGTQFGMAVRLAADGTTTLTDGTTPADSVVRQVLDATSLAPTDGFLIQGDTQESWFGASVSGAGDVNGDGFDDLIVGASQGDNLGEEAGEAYVIYGGAHFGEIIAHGQTLAAAASMPSLLGEAGDDRLLAHADTEVLYGGAGDDTLVLADTSFRRIDGGSGADTLELEAGLTLDLTAATVQSKIRGVEAVSLGTSATVTLDLETVYALTRTHDNAGALTEKGDLLFRLEGSGMVVLSDTADWVLQQADAEGEADLYVQDNALLLIDDGLYTP